MVAAIEQAPANMATEKKVAPSGNLSTLIAGSAIIMLAVRIIPMVVANRQCEKIFMPIEFSYWMGPKTYCAEMLRRCLEREC